MTIKIGTAGWSIPRQYADRLPAVGTALERYSALFSATEINSSFYRSHRTSTWARWASSVPAGFRFSVKVPREITHRRKLVSCVDVLDRFTEEVGALGEKLAVLLVQMPPKLAFDDPIASSFFSLLRGRTSAALACEPRHPSWFSGSADLLLEQLGVARVAADPSICPEAAFPGGWKGLSYTRLHGSPEMYRSSYRDRIDSYAHRFTIEAAEHRDVWCIFDNTASSAALGDALTLASATKSSR